MKRYKNKKMIYHDLHYIKVFFKFTPLLNCQEETKMVIFMMQD